MPLAISTQGAGYADDAAALTSLYAAQEKGGGALGADAAVARAMRNDPRRHAAVATSVWHGLRTLLRFRARASFGDPQYVAQRLGDKARVCVCV